MANEHTTDTAQDVREQVRAGYAKIAETGQWSGVRPASAQLEQGACGCQAGGCCGPETLTADQVATAVGYAQADLSALPEGANLGLSCGNPTALASLQAGEVVLDLGCGGGFDCFIAGPKVGETGRVIGVDMTAEMVGKARGNLAAYRQRSGLDNVEFRLGEIEYLPAADSSVDVVISNCVINLSPDKPQVWREIARVLKPGGRAAVSDLALLRPLPDAVQQMPAALIGCVAGAALVEEVERTIRAAGLTVVELKQRPEYVASMVAFGDPLYLRIAEALPEGAHVADFVTSLSISARKPE